ncbi:MAG: pentapeptide repeat-containing protein [Nitrospirota bacterium]|nr:pentapeptide repeat-containing protein [Nitrospirota bacterium]
MGELEQQSEPTDCPVVMSDGRPCGRPIHPAPSDVDERPVCLMHSREQRKDAEAFRAEIDAILLRTSVFHRPKDHFDFRYFVFHEANFGAELFTEKAFFGDARFIGEAIFQGAIFTKGADFGEATFAQAANFWAATFTQRANFRQATFTEEVDFGLATFTEGADFWGAMFTEGADFTLTLWGYGKDDLAREAGGEPAIASFHSVRLMKPEKVCFLRVNEKSRQGFRGRFVGCPIKGVLFEDVDWHREKGRMVLQDELDRLANDEEAASYEQVAAAYRRFIINFDEAKQYDLSEDCVIGAMEMKRLDPAQPAFVRLAVNLYRVASNYGSSYLRALLVLALLVVAFGLLYSFVGLTPRLGQTVLEPIGLIHAVEVATFKSETHAIAGSGAAWFLEIFERVLIPAQVALFLLALRRRFRR